jgi:hypothetical protein
MSRLTNEFIQPVLTDVLTLTHGGSWRLSELIGVLLPCRRAPKLSISPFPQHGQRPRLIQFNEPTVTGDISGEVTVHGGAHAREGD